MKEFSRYALAYLLWAVSLVVCFFIGFTAREVLFNSLVVSQAGTAGSSQSADFYLGLQLRAIEPWSYIVFGIALVILVVVYEHYFRDGVEKKLLIPRFLKVTGLEIAFLLIVHLIRFAIGMALGSVSWTLVITALVELALIGLLMWLYRKVFAQKGGAAKAV
jgi:hypothetical protein